MSYKKVTANVVLTIPSNIPRWEHSWPKWKPNYVAMGNCEAELKAYLEEKYPNAESITIRTSSHPIPYMSFSQGAGSEWNPTRYEMFSIGEEVTTRGDMGSRYYTCAEYEVEAREAVAEKRAEGARRQNAYYSQPWV